MLKAGYLENEGQARTFSDYLYDQGIETHIESRDDGTWELWVLDGDYLHNVRIQLEDYLKDPDNPKYVESVKSAQKKKKQKQAEQVAYRKKVYDRHRLFSRWRFRFTSVTGILMIISITVTFVSALGTNDSVKAPLLITEYETDGMYITWHKNLPEIRQGQVWRLVTPIFLHLSLLHILFNMMWLKELGHMLEAKQGPPFLIVMVLILGVLSNLGQFLVSGPNFGGMSGVIYGMLGYIWLRSRFNPSCGLFVSKHNVILMIGWFFLCLSGVIGHVANTAHGVGLVAGMIWGFASAKMRSRS
jgi:GlpG protein